MKALKSRSFTRSPSSRAAFIVTALSSGNPDCDCLAADTFFSVETTFQSENEPYL